jgi:hypothetical protein
MTENGNVDSFGRKIFFLHPSALMQNQILAELAQQEFEVYSAKDETKLRRVLKKFPDSIVFANINDGMKGSAWEEWIRGITAAPETAAVDIGIIASVADEEIFRKYSGFKITCGYTVLKADLNAAMKQLVDALNAVNAKGRRKYIRLITENETNTTVNLPVNGPFMNGLIKDISTVGFSCSFEEDPELTKNSLFGDIQIRLQTQLLKAEGIVFGSRADKEEKRYVILFTQRTSPDVRTRIRKYIHSCLQSRMDNELK